MSNTDTIKSFIDENFMRLPVALDGKVIHPKEIMRVKSSNDFIYVAGIGYDYVIGSKDIGGKLDRYSPIQLEHVRMI